MQMAAEARRWHQVPSPTGVTGGGDVPLHVDARVESSARAASALNP